MCCAMRVRHTVPDGVLRPHDGPRAYKVRPESHPAARAAAF